MRPDRRAVGSAVAERQDARVRFRIEGTQHHGRPRDVGGIDHHQPAVAGRRAAAAGLAEDGYRYIKALRLRIPYRLLDPRGTGEGNRIDRDLGERHHSAVIAIAVRRKQRAERRILGVVYGEEQLAVRRQRHLVDPRSATGVDGRLRERVGPVEIEHLERAVAVAGIKPPAVRRHAVGAGDVVVHRAAGVALDADKQALPEKPFEREAIGIDDVDRGVRAVGQVVLRAMRIDPADVIREQRRSRFPGSAYLHRGEAFRFGSAGCARPRANGEGRAANAERGGTRERMRKGKASNHVIPLSVEEAACLLCALGETAAVPERRHWKSVSAILRCCSYFLALPLTLLRHSVFPLTGQAAKGSGPFFETAERRKPDVRSAKGARWRLGLWWRR